MKPSGAHGFYSRLPVGTILDGAHNCISRSKLGEITCLASIPSGVRGGRSPKSSRPKNANKRYCSVAERTRSPQTARPGANSHALIGEHKVYASVAESLDEKVEKRTHLGHAMPTLRASSSSSAEGALNTVYEIEGALENDGLVIRGLHEAVLPPLTPSIWPVTNEALSDAR
jgi:hypothetical protein